MNIKTLIMKLTDVWTDNKYIILGSCDFLSTIKRIGKLTGLVLI